MGQRNVTGSKLDVIAPTIMMNLAKGYSTKQVANMVKINVAVVNSIKKRHKQEIEDLRSSLNSIESNNNIMIEDLAEFDNTNNPIIKVDNSHLDKDLVIITFDNKETSKEDTMEEIKMEKSKHYTVDRICYEDVLEDYCNINLSTDSIAEKYNISVGKLYTLLADFCGGKEHIPYRKRNKNTIRIMSDDEIIELVHDYELGTNEMLIKDILIKYNLTCNDLYHHLAKFYGSNDKIPKRRNVGTYKKNSKKGEGVAEDMGRTVGKKKRRTSGGKQQYVNNNDQIVKDSTSKIEEVAKEKVVVNKSVDNSIDFIGKTYNFDNVFRLLPSETTVQAGLVAGRHNIPVNKYIYTEITEENMCNFEWQYNTALKWLDENVKEGQQLLLYCTGIQSALSAVISACLNKKINLIEMHHNPSDSKYYAQQVLSFTDIKTSIWPFGKYDNSGVKFYGYNITSDDLESIIGTDLYCISLSEHAENNNEFIKDKCRYIIFRVEDEDALWDYYRMMINEIQNTTSVFRNSVMMSKINISQDYINWINNISKGYNWK